MAQLYSPDGTNVHPIYRNQKWLPWQQRPLERRNRLCFHRMAWPQKPTTRIKQCVDSYHTTEVIKVWTHLSTEFASNPILIDRIQIESVAGSNPIFIVKMCTALNRVVNFNERITAFTTDRACMPSSDIKGGKADIQLRCGPAHNHCSITPHPL